jgi:quercetin dioxygenase-like cupin family protein
MQMELINAVAKIRFSSAKAQCVQLSEGPGVRAELICLEAGQELTVEKGQWVYYVITGTTGFRVGEKSQQAPTGQIVVFEQDQKHTLSAAGERRSVCLATGREN